MTDGEDEHLRVRNRIETEGLPDNYRPYRIPDKGAGDEHIGGT